VEHVDFAVGVPRLLAVERHHRVVGELREVDLGVLVFDRVVRVRVRTDDRVELAVRERLDVVAGEF